MKMLTANEVAQQLRLEPQTVVRHLRRSELRGSKVGRRWLVAEADVQAFVDERANFRPAETRRRRRP